MDARQELIEYTNSSFTETGRAEIRRLLDGIEKDVRLAAAGSIYGLAYEMRSCDGTWDEEFSNEYVGDALDIAASKVTNPDKDN